MVGLMVRALTGQSRPFPSLYTLPPEGNMDQHSGPLPTVNTLI